MSTRTKLLLAFTVFGVVPVVGLGVVGYLNGRRAVEAQLRGEAEREVRFIAGNVDGRLREREDALTMLARSPALRDYLRGARQAQTASGTASGYRAQPGTYASPPRSSPSPSPSPAADDQIPKDVQGEVRSFLQGGQKYYVSVTCLGADRRPLFRAEPNRGGAGPAARFQTRDFLPNSLKADERVWSTSEPAPLRSPAARESFGSVLRYTAPVFVGEDGGERGALILDLKLDALLDDAAGSVAGSEAGRDSGPQNARVVLILDRDGNAVYHSNDVLKYQPIATAMPASFRPVADAMSKGQAGWQFFTAPEGDEWAAAYQPLAPLDVAIAVALDYTAAVSGQSRSGWLIIGLIALIALAAAGLLWLYLRRQAGSIQRITQGAVAIAGGRLDERIEVQSSDETRVLADTFNQMSDRLREQIAREAESRQFESFMRLSAMLTHDLKNSIQALSLVVSNMEQQFHHEEFRADAMQSLREATSKLGTLVAKLSEPVRSLSGEFKRPRPVDLVPVIRRALDATAEQAAKAHDVDVDIQLPSMLAAVADDERIEKVVENLVLNALEAMASKRGRLTVTAGPAEEGFVFFSVSDTGTGMTQEFQRSRLFRPFATTKSKGVGLGLYTCRELIRALGGRIEVESQRGSGTTFRVVLPSGEITGGAQQGSSRA
ncbi:MAG TPA: ATP-binding protein [Pyrinomonadaceae bacterium]|jgi:signal transduction histidine kinase